MKESSKNPLASIVKISVAWILAFILSLLLIETSLFGFLVRLFPPNIIYYFDRGTSTFYQYSKKHDVPKNYIAIFGDSYAEGQGDWFFNNQFSRLPETQATHVLHNTSGKDVVSFGFADSGSMDAYLTYPTSIIHYIRSLWFYDIKDPEFIFLYFYEGNDIIDNVRDYKILHDISGMTENEVNKDTLKTTFLRYVLPKNTIEIYAKENTLHKNMIFSRFFIFAAKATWESIKNGTYNNKTLPRRPEAANPDTRVWIAGQQTSIPQKLQTAPVDYPENQLKTALNIFTSSIQLVSELYPNTKIGVVYIPSPASSYRFASGKVVSLSDKLQREIDPTQLADTSDKLCDIIQSRTIANNIFFHDIRAAIRAESSRHQLHGPSDWNHFSEHGYKTLARELLTFMQYMQQATEKRDTSSLLSSPCTRLQQTQSPQPAITAN